MIPKKTKKEQQLQPKKDKRSEMVLLPLLPLPLQRQIQRKALSFEMKKENLEGCLKKINKSKETPKECKKSNENLKPNSETNCTSTAKAESSRATSKVPEVKEKRKPGRPGKKKINT